MTSSNIPSKKSIIAGWGNYPAKECLLYRPERIDDIYSILKNHQNSLIPRGQGKSYGDASLNKNGTILSERLDKFLSFDKEKGIIKIESGVTFAEILDIVIPKGWFLPVIPGTKYVSAGGAFACNVHGKNHYQEGDFADHVLEITLQTPDNKTVICSKEENSTIFWSTAAGYGMTGFIKELTIKLKPIESLSLCIESKKVQNIHEMIKCFEESKKSHEYMIGWIDHFAKNENLGRGVFEKANHIANTQEGQELANYRPQKKRFSIPKFFPGFILNKYSMAIYNFLRFAKFSFDWKKEIVNFDGFFHPLDRLGNWNRLYGKNGFFQYQFIIPETEKVADNLIDILSFIQKKGLFSFLAVIKYHKNSNGIMSFPIKGYSIALDFPNNKKTLQLLKDLNIKISDLNGRVYLAKDSTLDKNMFKKMYSNNLKIWQDIIKELDKENRINSSMSERLNFKDYE